MNALRYTTIDNLEACSYTRWLGVDVDHRRRGIGRALLTRALYEMHREGYERAVLNVRVKNKNARQLYIDVGYETRDESFAYVKDLGT
jgi:ribosomal protein S18 acetylase RimI-like enzyme